MRGEEIFCITCSCFVQRVSAVYSRLPAEQAGTEATGGDRGPRARGHTPEQGSGHGRVQRPGMPGPENELSESARGQPVRGQGALGAQLPPQQVTVARQGMPKSSEEDNESVSLPELTFVPLIPCILLYTFIGWRQASDYRLNYRCLEPSRCIHIGLVPLAYAWGAARYATICGTPRQVAIMDAATLWSSGASSQRASDM